ncbi:hypothetical protein C8Q72DRAFT_798369 [Fomitopsis betulina]|nr:hypothetical protein C8Q72DRAFT_798369 [Fomitopsis betulina]
MITYCREEANIQDMIIVEYIMATPDLTAEQLRELVLVLSGKVHTALAASSNKHGRAEAQLTDKLKYMSVLEKYAKLKLSMPHILASMFNVYFALGQVRLDHLNDPTIKCVIGAMFCNEELDYSPSLMKCKAGDDTGSSGVVKKTKTATLPAKKVVLTLKATPAPSPLLWRNRGHKSTETVDNTLLMDMWPKDSLRRVLKNNLNHIYKSSLRADSMLHLHSPVWTLNMPCQNLTCKGTPPILITVSL